MGPRDRIGLVVLGGCVAVFGGADYVRSAHDLRHGRYRSSLRLSVVVVAAVALAAILLAAYAFATR